MALTIEKNYQEEAKQWVVVLKGEVDLHSAGVLNQAMRDVMNERMETVRIEAKELDYIDSTGLSVFIRGYKELRAHDKQLILSGIKPSIKKLLKITGLDKILIVEEST